jgi:sigma-B regulation protein RsbU (phosphoserine phosphatase)
MLCIDLPESSFVSLVLAELDAGRRELRHVGAGHQALLFRVGGSVETLGSTGPLLGIDADAAYDRPPATPVGEGDLLVLFTDGLTEARSRAGEQFGQGRLKEAVRRHLREPSQVVLDRLFAAVYDFAGGQPIQDDMTAVAVKVLG